MRRLLVPALLLPALLVPPAGAASTGLNQSAFLIMNVVADGHSYDIVLLGSVPTQASNGTSPELRLQVTDTGDAEDNGTKYVGALTASSLSVSDTAAQLRTRIDGQLLSVTWRVTEGEGGGGESVSLEQDRKDPGLPRFGYFTAGRTADVKVVLGGATCAPSAFGMLGYAVSDEGRGALPLAEAFHLEHATCGDVSHETVP
jgi:hypothetical protein